MRDERTTNIEDRATPPMDDSGWVSQISDFKSIWNVQHFKSIWNVFLHFCLKPEITFDTKSLLHEHLHRVFWLFTNPANGCLLTAIHPLPFSMTNIAMYSKCWPVSIIYQIVVSISNNDNVMDFRDRKKTELSENGYFEGQKQASLADGSRVGSPTCIVLWTK